MHSFQTFRCLRNKHASSKKKLENRYVTYFSCSNDNKYYIHKKNVSELITVTKQRIRNIKTTVLNQSLSKKLRQ